MDRTQHVHDTLARFEGAFPGGLSAQLPELGRPWQPPSLEAGLAGFIDHTLLKPTAEQGQLEQLASEARQHSFASCCVNGVHVARMAQLLEGSSVPACAVVGFPLGAMHPGIMAAEAEQAVADGAREIDMVVDIGALKDRALSRVHDGIAGVVACGQPVKVILETCHLTEEEKILGCALSVIAGAAFVKTSTGFGGGGATEADVALMRYVVGPDIGVKASGGIRNAETARRMIAAGANRLGASSSVAIVSEGV
ncbi:MAG: deoxyribose-phosphate aldolase [Bradymonadia bacterium]